MAMTKAEQRAAAERILAKAPLTPEEELRFKMVSRTPEEYDFPGERRKCGECGEIFEDEVDKKGQVVVTMLEKFSDHQAQHNPTPAQWSEAYNKIQGSKQKQES